MDAARLIVKFSTGIPTPVLIESHEGDGVIWGVSFNGPNPERKDFVECASAEDAARLMNFLNCTPAVRLEDSP